MKNNGFLINKRGTWQNKENCKKEAEKYSRKIDFQKGSKCAYNSALKNGWIKEMFI